MSSGFALTAWCPLPPAAMWSSFSKAQCCQTLWSWLHYQMSTEWDGLFYHLTQLQLSPRHPHTCKGRYMTLLMPHCEVLCISDWDGQESRPSQDRLAALQRHWRGNQKYPLRYVRGKEWWKYARSALYSLSLIDTQSGEDTFNLHGPSSWHEGKQRTTESVEQQAVFFILNIFANQISWIFHGWSVTFKMIFDHYQPHKQTAQGAGLSRCNMSNH